MGACAPTFLYICTKVGPFVPVPAQIPRNRATAHLPSPHCCPKCAKTHPHMCMGAQTGNRQGLCAPKQARCARKTTFNCFCATPCTVLRMRNAAAMAPCLSRWQSINSPFIQHRHGRLYTGFASNGPECIFKSSNRLSPAPMPLFLRCFSSEYNRYSFKKALYTSGKSAQLCAFLQFVNTL